MNETVEKFSLLLSNYRLSEPISAEQQEYIIKRRKSELRDLLKVTGRLGVFFWLAVIIYEGFKSVGIKLSFVQCKIILGITAAAMAAGSGTGIYSGSKYFMKAKHAPPVQFEEKKDEGPENKNQNVFIERKAGSPRLAGKIINTDISIQGTFESNGKLLVTRHDAYFVKDGMVEWKGSLVELPVKMGDKLYIASGEYIFCAFTDGRIAWMQKLVNEGRLQMRNNRLVVPVKGKELQLDPDSGEISYSK